MIARSDRDRIGIGPRSDTKSDRRHRRDRIAIASGSDPRARVRPHTRQLGTDRIGIGSRPDLGSDPVLIGSARCGTAPARYFDSLDSLGSL